MIFPTVILDAFVEFYQQTCFRLYDIPLNKRESYIRIDRQKLKYLNNRQKFNCMYCGYVNGVFHYVSKIAADTEKYWCGIKHKEDKTFHAPPHHTTFITYDDEEAFNEIKNTPSKDR